MGGRIIPLNVLSGETAKKNHSKPDFLFLQKTFFCSIHVLWISSQCVLYARSNLQMIQVHIKVSADAMLGSEKRKRKRESSVFGFHLLSVSSLSLTW